MLNIVLGAGGQAREIEWLLSGLNRRVDYFVVDDSTESREQEAQPCVRICDLLPKLAHTNAVSVFVGLGPPAAKLHVSAQLITKVAEQLPGIKLDFQPLLDASIRKPQRSTLGLASVVQAGTTISTDVRIGAFCTINLHCTITHDCSIGNFATLAPGVNLGGRSIVEDFADIGLNACVLPSVRVGKRSVVGAGAVVIKDVPSYSVVVGNPARVIKQIQQGPPIPQAVQQLIDQHDSAFWN